MADSKLIMLILSIVSAIIAGILLIIAIVYLARGGCRNHYHHGGSGRSNYDDRNRRTGDRVRTHDDGDSRSCITMARLIAGILGIVGSLVQLVFAIILILLWKNNIRKYFIIHIVCMAIIFIATVLCCIDSSYWCEVCDAFLAFGIIDWLFCFISSLCVCVFL